MSKIKWRKLTDEYDNTYYEGASPYHDDGIPINWIIRQRLRKNRVEWFADHDRELNDHVTVEVGMFWKTLEKAKADCQKSHDAILEEIAP